jgi:hypothetical protein
MATPADPQNPSRHAGQVVRRVLLRRNIAIDPEAAQLVADAVQAVLRPARLPGRRAGARAAPPPAASRCSDMAVANRPRACSCQITGNRTAPVWRCSRRWHFCYGGRSCPTRQLSRNPAAALVILVGTRSAHEPSGTAP